LVYTGEDDGVDEMFKRVEEGMRRRGAVVALAASFGFRARWHLLRGRLSEAEADARAALEPARFGLGSAGSDAGQVLARVLLERGDTAEALTVASATAERPSAAGVFRALPLLERGRVQHAAGRAADALASAE